MSLMKCELKKTMRSPLVWIVLVVVLIIDVVQIFMGSFPSLLSTDIQSLKERYAYFSGAITQEWIDHYQQEAEAILNNPQYQVSEQEAEEIVQRFIDEYGYTEEAVRNNLVLFLNEDGLDEYEKYQDVQVASNFYVNAFEYGDMMAQYYTDTYPGKKGEVLATYTQEHYNYLASEYTANYDYCFGYSNIRNILTVYPYTTGLAILVALAPLFSSEYAKRTDALLLTTKNGKRKLVHAKVMAGTLITVLIWGAITILNIVLIFGLYGTTGWNAFWQDWIIRLSPFPWNQGIITMVALITSLLGTLFFAFILMLISSISKNQFISIVIGAAILLFPVFDFDFTNNYIVNMIYHFLPTRIMMGETIWQSFNPFYIAGIVVPHQYVIMASAIMISICTIPFTGHFFIKHQVEN